ncbi:hypothetical protein V0288_04650 [Pannus brasiliensis CCIBt3594]|uniref:Uncharacterized protein n=1 Tax=Pannus brasiliensis CCIBt3594 TaxID=1427578 RepID=A0AAW9QST1_9CHRO
MKKIIIFTFYFIFYFLLIILLIVVAKYAWSWLKSDNSGEAVVAIITMFFIPPLYVVKEQFEKRYLEKPHSPKEAEKDLDQLSVNINRREIRCYGEYVDYAIQIDLEIYAHRKVSIKSIKLSCEEPFGYSNKRRDLSKLPKLTRINCDLLSNQLDTLMSIIENSEKLEKTPFIIEESEHLLLTISGYVSGERLPDAWEGLRLSGWNLEIEYNDNRKYISEFDLIPHQKSLKVPTKYHNIGFYDA